MKKLFLAFIAILTLTLFGTTKTFASANDFYFTNTTFDYYLEKLEDGRGKMHIEEELTAIFPSTNQNHGIERCIPKKYNGTNILPHPNFVVLRNGDSEPFKIYNDGKFRCLRIGNANAYVHGMQTYTISYDVENVILNPIDATGQELYWDINGTGWSQDFGSVTARVHLPESLNLARKSQDDKNLSCYVGKYGTYGSAVTSRCTITAETSDDTKYPYVLTFAAEDLKPAEGMTIDIEFEPNVFFIKGPDPNYSLIIAIGVTTIISALLIVKWVKTERKIKDKKTLAKDKVIPVQYVPPQGLTVAEAGTVWLKGHKSLQVATLMELAVHHHIELEKGEKKTFGGYHWKIHAKDVENLKPEQKIVLEILNGGATVHDGDVIEVKRHSSTSHLEKLGRDFPKKIEGSLRGKQLFEPEKTSKSSSALSVFAVIIVATAICIGVPILFSTLFETLGSSDESSVTILFVSAAFFVLVFASTITTTRISKYKKRTIKGIKTSKYLDGLEDYMDLAEEDRIKFLQSVKGADTSNQGIVKLWEKLLPYAVIFGIEDSWMSELNKYYQMDDINNPYWLHGTTYLPISDFHSFTSYTASSISSSTASSDSGGSSGGGGGGFSGGGGGGGGGGGW